MTQVSDPKSKELEDAVREAERAAREAAEKAALEEDDSPDDVLRRLLVEVLDFNKQNDLTSPLTAAEKAVVEHPAILVNSIQVTKRIGFAILNRHYRHVMLLHGAERIRVLAMDSAKDGAFYATGQLCEVLRNIKCVWNVPATDGAEAKIEKGSLAAIWLNHPIATEVNRWAEEVFKPLGINEPEHDAPTDRKFNLWTPWPWKPLPNYPKIKGVMIAAWMERDCPTLHEYLLKTVCSGRMNKYLFMLAWLADMIQNPGRKHNRAALVFKSISEGTGKDTFGRLAISLLPPENVYAEASVDDLIRFTGAFAGKLLVIFPEFSYDAGQDSSKVRRNAYQLIDSPTMRCEDKGVKAQTVDNSARVIHTTNDEHPLPKNSKGRRYDVTEVGSGRVDDSVYWSKIYAVIDDKSHGGEWHRFATMLARLVVKGFNPAAHKPNTGEMEEVIEHSIGGFGAMLREVLDNGALPYTATAERAIDIETCGKRQSRDPAPWQKLLNEQGASKAVPGGVLTQGVLPGWGKAYHFTPENYRTFYNTRFMRKDEKLGMSPTALGRYLAQLAISDKDHLNNIRGKWWPELDVARRLFELMYAKGHKIDWSNDLTAWTKVIIPVHD